MSFKSLAFSEDSLQLLDSHNSSLSYSQFLQSSRWAQFQKSEGKRVEIFSNEEGGQILLAIRQQLPLGKSYWYIPRGPNVRTEQELEATIHSLQDAIRKIDAKALFIRFDPVGIESANLKKTIDVQPSRTLLLELEGPTEKLLGQMHQKTRYNIRLGEKKGLSIKRGREHTKEFLDMLSETGERDKFRLHGKKYYEEMIASGAVELVTAWHENDMLAGALLAYFGDTVTYVHGASSSKKRALMAPYFLHWSAIKQACDAGYKYYDWHGIDDKKWPGVTRFKKGFGGVEKIYPGTFDAILAPLAYAGYTGIRLLRRMLPF